MNKEPIEFPCDVFYDEVDGIVEISYLGLTVAYPMGDLENANLYLPDKNMVNEKLIFATKRQVEQSLMAEN